MGDCKLCTTAYERAGSCPLTLEYRSLLGALGSGVRDTTLSAALHRYRVFLKLMKNFVFIFTESEQD